MVLWEAQALSWQELNCIYVWAVFLGPKGT